MTDMRLVPEDGENPYADHPGFKATGCSLRHTVTPARMGSTSSHGFACLGSGGHCVPNPEHCQRMLEKEARHQELEAQFKRR